MLQKTSTALIILLFISTLSIAQTTIIEGVEKAWLHGFGTIMEGDDLKGYYFFYGEKREYGQRNFQLQAYDKELKLTFKRKIIAPAGMILQNMAFDGNNFMLKVYRSSADVYGYMIFDRDGKLIDNDTQRKGTRRVQNRKLNIAPESNTLVALPGGGFLSHTPILGKRQGWEIECFESNGTSKWRRSSDPKSKLLQTLGELGASERIILNYRTFKHSDRAAKLTYRVQGLDTQTGEILFEVKLNGYDDEKTDTEVLKGFINEDANEILILGISKDASTGIDRGSNDGLYLAKINLEGEMLDEKHIKWDDAESFLKENEWHKQLGQPTWFHEVLKTKDGGYFVIGEQFNIMPPVSNAASSAALLLDILNRPHIGSATLLSDILDEPHTGRVENYAGVHVGDLVIYEFSPKLELQNVSTFSKDGAYFNVFKNNQTIHTISEQVLALDMFGFHDIHVNETTEDFSIEMMEYYRLASKKHNEFYFKTATKKGDDYQENSVKIESASGVPSIRKTLVAKDGYIMISEFYPNKNKIVNRLEQVKN